jgi:hypothetical protein
MNRIYGQSTRRLWPHAGGNGRLRAYHSPRGLLCAPVTSQDGAAYARGGKGKMVPSQAAGLAKGGIARPAAGQRRCQRHHNRRHHRHRSGRSRGHSRRHERSQSSPKSQAQQPLPQQALSQQASSPQALSQQASQRRSLCIGFRWLSGGVTLDSRGQSSHHPSGRTFTTPMPRSGISDLPTRCFSWRRARHARFRAGATRPTVSNAHQRPSRARPMHPSRRGAVRVA